MIDQQTDKGTISFVQRGETIKASTLNAIIRALRPFHRMEAQKYLRTAARKRPVKNTGGTEIPAWSPMEITSMVDGIAQVSRPTADNIQPGLILFTREQTIGTTAMGWGYSAFDEPIQVETDSSTVTEQAEYGTQANSFELIEGGTGFVCLGAGEDADAVMRPFRAGVPVTYTIEFLAASWPDCRSGWGFTAFSGQTKVLEPSSVDWLGNPRTCWTKDGWWLYYNSTDSIWETIFYYAPPISSYTGWALLKSAISDPGDPVGDGYTLDNADSAGRATVWCAVIGTGVNYLYWNGAHPWDCEVEITAN